MHTHKVPSSRRGVPLFGEALRLVVDIRVIPVDEDAIHESDGITIDFDFHWV